MKRRAKGAGRSAPGGARGVARSASLGAFGVLAFALAGCRQLVGLDDVGCVPGCSADGLVRLECGAGGRVTAVACGEGSSCNGGVCALCVDRCDGPNARLACAPGRGAERELCPAERPLCTGGACVACFGADDCPASSDVCVEAACEGGLCVGRPVDVAERRKAYDEQPGDCAAFFCSAGGPIELDDESDVPPAGDECTIGRCAAGGVSVAPGFVPEGASCRAGAGRCDGEGGCRGPAQLASKSEHTCALMNDGDVWCWGANELNQLGDAEGKLETPADDRELPVHVRGFGVRGGTGLRAVARGPSDRALAANYRFTCAIVEAVGNGQVLGAPKVRCWGTDPAAVETTGEFWEPRLPAGGRAPVSLAAGEAFACLLFDDRRSLACWGDGSVGQLGTGSIVDFPTSQAAPVALPPLGEGETVTSFAAGKQHACALLSGGRVVCWGSNHGGQLKGESCPCPEGCAPPGLVLGPPICGEGGSFVPIEVGPLPLLPGELPERVTAGASATCVVTSAGRGLCWGSNVNGELGRQLQQVGTFLPPGPVEEADAEGGLSTLTSLGQAAFGFGQHGCGLGVTGQAFCWGATDLGQVVPVALGFEQPLPAGCNRFGSGKICRPSAARGPLLGGPAVDVVAGQKHSCALLADGSVWCWGENGRGQRGNGAFSPLPAPELPPTRVLW